MRSTLWLALVLVGCPQPTASELPDEDGDGHASDVDCNDGAPSVFPGAIELCDGIDQDCDGSVEDEPTVALFEDRDGDGFGDAARTLTACGTSQGVVANGADCDDADVDLNPDAPETCDGIDSNCSGDEADAEDRLAWYWDADEDGYGTTSRVYDCEQPDGYADRSGDCSDSNGSVSPAADELCNGVDDDCDKETDEADAIDPTEWFPDGDGDGYGTPGVPSLSCAPPLGYGEGEADCDDADPARHPGVDEVCDGVDQDCDGTVDEEPVDGSTWYSDGDLDGAGDPTRFAVRCAADVGLVASSDDCDDADSSAFPGATELCDGADDDCDGAIDDGAADASDWFADVDEDGFGDPASLLNGCSAPPDHIAVAGDCDDADDSSYPEAPELCDGADNDCDGAIDGLWVDTDFATTNPLTINGASRWDSTGANRSIWLTEALPDESGTAWYDVLPDDRFVATFSLDSSGGTGGQGVAIAFLDESDLTLVGTTDVFGLGGLSGYAVGFDTVADLVVLIDTSTGSTVATASVSALQDTGPHEVVVRFDAGAVEVDLDGVLVLASAIPSYTGWLPLIGFSASTTTSATANQILDDVRIGCP